MKLSAPTQSVFYVAVILAILALIGTFVTIPYITQYGFWILFVGFVVLVFGNTTTGA